MLLNLMKARRSVRKYQDRSIESEKIDMLKQAALLSPTSKNKRGWEFVFVENKETLDRLSHAKTSGGLMIGGAALAIVVAVDSANNDVWVEDGSIAAAYINLMAEELGLGCCWVQVRNRMDEAKNIPASANIRDIVGLPENLDVVCIMSVGYKSEEPKPKELSSGDYAKIHIEKY